MIETLFFDLGNTLIDFSDEKMWKQLSNVSQTPSNVLKNIISKNHLWKDYEIGQISTDEFIEKIRFFTKTSFSNEDFIFAASNIFSEKIEMVDLIKSLQQSGITLGIISNTCQIHIDFIKERYKLLEYFTHLILSYEVKMRKPDLQIYTHALTKLNTSPKLSLFIDDLKENIEGAEKLGIHSLHFKEPALLRKDLKKVGITL
jgi:putative hydrolase of the HAD superfamily